MKKKFLFIMLCSILLLGLTGCGNNNSKQENKLQANDFSGVWKTQSGTTYYFDCSNKYKWSSHETNFLDEKGKTFVSYGTYTINGNSITITNENNGKKEAHFLEKKNGEIDKNTICITNGDCFNKTSPSTCEKLREITKEN